MVLAKIAIVVAAIAGLLGVARNQMWFERVGLMAECKVTATPFGEQGGGQWWACREGAISGFPNLRRDHCETKGVTGRIELWYCPVAIARPS